MTGRRWSIAGTERIRTGEHGRVLEGGGGRAGAGAAGRAGAGAGQPVHHATLGPLEEWLEEQAGPGVIDGDRGRAVLRGRVKGERERLLTRAFMIRVDRA